ncbi:MAG TPA: MBL fold metallo-hydrolase, partial [Acidimicrobiia bacterium]|nr:MBL fold metallo-hydrolase [Acidimicrobiia bacterium]
MLEVLGDGVWAWLQPGGGSGISNAGVILDEDGLTVVDCLMVRSQWEPFAAAVNGLGVPVRRLVLTHAHVDHVGGSMTFPLAAVFGTPATSALMDQPLMTDAYKTFMPAFAAEFDALEETGTRRVTHEVHDAAALTGRIEVLPVAGHTQGDLMVLVDDADVLFAGDVCFFGVTPLAFQGDPAAWAAVLGAVSDLASRVVPGHGPIGGEREVLDQKAYLDACVAGSVPPGPWDAWI